MKDIVTTAVPGETRSIRWERSGAASLLDLEGFTQANGVSADGSVIVGSLGELADEGYRYDGALRERFDHGLADVSDDGSVWVGADFDEQSNWDTVYGVRGGAGNGDLSRLTPLEPGRPTMVYSVSGDGRVSVGFVDDADGHSHAAFWSEDGALNVLDAFPGAIGSIAVSANRDGSVIIGTVYFDDDLNEYYAVRWTSNGIERLATDVGHGMDVSGDGNRILIRHDTPSDFRVAIWDAGTLQIFDEWFSPQDFGRTQPLRVGTDVWGLTRDGRSAYGLSGEDDVTRAFIARLPF